MSQTYSTTIEATKSTGGQVAINATLVGQINAPALSQEPTVQFPKEPIPFTRTVKEGMYRGEYRGVHIENKSILFSSPVSRGEDGDIALGYVETYRGFYTCLQRSRNKTGYYADATCEPFHVITKEFQGRDAREQALTAIHAEIDAEWERIARYATAPRFVGLPAQENAKKRLAMFAPFLDIAPVQDTDAPVDELVPPAIAGADTAKAWRESEIATSANVRHLNAEETREWCNNRIRLSRLAAACASARQKNFAPLRELIIDVQKDWNAAARLEAKEHSLWRYKDSLSIGGVATKDSIFYTRTRVNATDERDAGEASALDGVVRFDCDDQAFADKVNAEARRFDIDARLETKYVAIFDLLLEQLWKGRLRWESFAMGAGYVTRPGKGDADVNLRARHAFLASECAEILAIKNAANTKEVDARNAYGAYKEELRRTNGDSAQSPQFLTAWDEARCDWRVACIHSRNAQMALGRVEVQIEDAEEQEQISEREDAEAQVAAARELAEGKREDESTWNPTIAEPLAQTRFMPFPTSGNRSCNCVSRKTPTHTGDYDQ